MEIEGGISKINCKCILGAYHNLTQTTWVEILYIIQKQTMVEERLPQSTCVSKSPEQTKSSNMASPEITAHVF